LRASLTDHVPGRVLPVIATSFRLDQSSQVRLRL
jgi:hypothetical protein